MEIKGLPKSGQKAQKSYLIKRVADGDFEIHFLDAISFRRLNSLWYGGNIVKISHKDYTFYIMANGDVRADLYSVNDGKHLCHIRDKGCNGKFGTEMLRYFKSDGVLKNALSDNPRKYRIELHNNNWWDLIVSDRRGEEFDLMCVLDDERLTGAIVDVITRMDDIISDHEMDSLY